MIEFGEAANLKMRCNSRTGLDNQKQPYLKSQQPLVWLPAYVQLPYLSTKSKSLFLHVRLDMSFSRNSTPVRTKPQTPLGK